MNARERERLANRLRAEGVSERAILSYIEEQEIYDKLRKIGRKIAVLAEPIQGQGGDHPYDGAMNAVWRGLHEGLGATFDGCMIENSYSVQCSLMPPSKPGARKTISTSKRKRVYERDAYKCVTCGTYKDLSLGHIVPVSKGGSDDDANLQTLCMPCNRRKGIR